MRQLLGRFSTISGLLFGGSPSTISRLIVSVIVDAIQRFPFRPFSHVGKKRFKTVDPLSAHYDPSACVVPLVLWSYPSTPVFCGLPASISGRARHAMGPRLVSSQFFFKAPAAFGVSRLQVMPGTGHNISAGAFAHPIDPPSFTGWGFSEITTKNNKAAKRHTSKVEELAHG